MLVCRISKEIDYGVDTFICYKRQKKFLFRRKKFYSKGREIRFFVVS